MNPKQPIEQMCPKNQEHKDFWRINYKFYCPRCNVDCVPKDITKRKKTIPKREYNKPTNL